MSAITSSPLSLTLVATFAKTIWCRFSVGAKVLSNGFETGPTPLDRQVSMLHEFDDRALVLRALDGSAQTLQGLVGRFVRLARLVVLDRRVDPLMGRVANDRRRLDQSV